MNSFLKTSGKVSFLKVLSISFLSSFCFLSLLWAQPSVLEVMEDISPCVVDITSEATKTFQAGKPARVVDKRTGRTVILHNLKTAGLTKSGAGVVIDSSGLIVTNAHVVANAKVIMVTLHNKTRVHAKIVRFFPQDDLAILSVAPSPPLMAIKFANSEAIKLKDDVVTIGHSNLLDQTVSGGKVIGLGKSESESNRKKSDKPTELFQVNMNIYKGDSGGPLFNKYGELIGLMVAGQTEHDRSSFAISSNKIRRYYSDYLKETASH